MSSRAQCIIAKLDEVVGLVGAAAINTAGQQVMAKKRREEKVRAGGHGDALDKAKKDIKSHDKAHTGKLLMGKKKAAFKAKRTELKDKHQSVVNKGLASHAKLMSTAGKKGQQEMSVK